MASPAPVVEAFRQEFKKAREQAGLTQEQVARKIGVSLSNVRSWERGDYGPRYEQLVALCHLFNWPLPFRLDSSADSPNPGDVIRQSERRAA